MGKNCINCICKEVCRYWDKYSCHTQDSICNVAEEDSLTEAILEDIDKKAGEMLALHCKEYYPISEKTK